MAKDGHPSNDGLIKMRYFNYDLFCTEFTVYTQENNYDQSAPFLFAQAFSDRIKVWWPTDKTLVEICRVAGDVYSFCGNVNEADGPGSHFDWDVFLYLNNYEVRHFKIDADALTALSDDIPVSLYRISMPGCDFYIEGSPGHNGKQRAGIETSLRSADLLEKYILSTHAKGVDAHFIAELTGEILSSTCFE